MCDMKYLIIVQYIQLRILSYNNIHKELYFMYYSAEINAMSHLRVKHSCVSIPFLTSIE